VSQEKGCIGCKFAHFYTTEGFGECHHPTTLMFVNAPLPVLRGFRNMSLIPANFDVRIDRTKNDWCGSRVEKETPKPDADRSAASKGIEFSSKTTTLGDQP